MHNCSKAEWDNLDIVEKLIFTAKVGSQTYSTSQLLHDSAQEIIKLRERISNIGWERDIQNGNVQGMY